MISWPENAHRCARVVYEDKSACVRCVAWQSANTETGKAERSKEACAISLTLLEVVTGSPKPFCLQCHTCANPITQILHIIATMSFRSSFPKLCFGLFSPPKCKAHWHANISEHGLSRFQSIHWCSSITCCVLYWGQQSSPTLPGFHHLRTLLSSLRP